MASNPLLRLPGLYALGYYVREIVVPLAGNKGQSDMNSKHRSPPQRHFSAGVRLIERTISPSAAPVIGLYLYMASGWLGRSMGRGSRFAAIRPGSIGVPALLKAHPGLSQT